MQIKWRLLAGLARCVAAAALLGAAASAQAQAPGNGFSGIGGENSKKPIDIESDRLEVDDKRQMAIFSGNVSATQGDYNLRSKVLEVTYERAPSASNAQGKAGAAKALKTAKAPAADGGGDPLSSGQVKFIHATGGRVLLTSKKDDQTATGNEGFYDVKAQKVTMTGDVTLSQKGNVVKGEKLLIDLATGRAIVDPDESGDKPHRIRAILRRQTAGTEPEENPLTAAKKKPKAAKQNSDTSKVSTPDWKTQSE